LRRDHCSYQFHQAKFHKVLLERWEKAPSPERQALLLEALMYDGLWLTKFPLLSSPTFGIGRLDALNKASQVGASGLWSETLALRPLVDADVLRFVLARSPAEWNAPVELFFGGRAMNKPLWQYVTAWFERAAALRGRLSLEPSVLDTAFW